MTATPIKTRRRSLGRNRRGAAAVEAAIVLPVLIILTFGSIDLAQYITTSQTVVNASREGARFATRANTTSASEVQAVVSDYLAASYPQHKDQMSAIVKVVVLDSAGAPVSGAALENVESGEQLTVVVDFDFKAVRWLPGPKYAANNVYISSTVCRKE